MTARLSINDGEFFALLGPSGCGKTTLLRTIAGLEAATSGTIHIGERDVTALQPGDRNLAMVFQDYALYPHMTVRDNIAYPLKIKHVGRTERYAEATAAAGNLSLGQLVGPPPGPAVGRPAAACRPRQGDRHPARRVPLRRAAVEPRRPPAPGGPHVPQAAAARAGDDGDLRHPRPERGARPRRPHGGDGVRRDPPGRHAERAVPPSGERVRRRVHRLDADEPDAGGGDRRRCRRRQRHAAARRQLRRGRSRGDLRHPPGVRRDRRRRIGHRNGVDHREPRHRLPRHRRRRRRDDQGDDRRRATSRSPATPCRSPRRPVGCCCTTRSPGALL